MKENYSRVFIPHLPTRTDPIKGTQIPIHDVSKAQEFGSIFCLCEGKIQGDVFLKDALLKAKKVLASVSFLETDYVMVLGHALLFGALLNEAKMRDHQHMNLLFWSLPLKSYVHQVLDLESCLLKDFPQ